MSKSLKELRSKVKPKVQAAARAKAVGIIAEMTLAETRKARGLSQSVLAQSMNLAQPNVSQIENRPDALVSTLNDYIEALGGTLEIRARFPDGQEVKITQFNHT